MPPGPPGLGAFVLSVALAVLPLDARPPRVAAPTVAELLAARVDYPAHWWAAVPKEGAPDWEIRRRRPGPAR